MIHSRKISSIWETDKGDVSINVSVESIESSRLKKIARRKKPIDLILDICPNGIQIIKLKRKRPLN